MASRSASPKQEPPPPMISSIPQKRAFEEDHHHHHHPTVSSPLRPNNPDHKGPSAARDEPMARERASRAKKESLKKREAKGAIAPAVAAVDPRDAPPPKQRKVLDGAAAAAAAAVAPLRYKLPPPKLSDFEARRGPVFTPHMVKQAPDGSQIQFHETSDHVYNKKNFHYTHCIADPAFPSSLHYRQTETIPFGARLNFEDTSTHMFHDESGKHITTDKGFRMAKANVCIREGRWYWECRITSGIPNKARVEANAEAPRGHVRMGWARREATLDAPVGFDAYSYAIRDVAGQKVFMSRPKDFFPPGEDVREGDVVGLEINLPSERLHRKVVEGHFNPAVDLEDNEPETNEAPDIIRDRVPIRFKAHLYFEQIEYHSTKELEELMNPSPVVSSAGGSSGAGTQEPGPTHAHASLRTLPHSYIKVYKNGVPMGTAFTELLAFLPPASRPLAQVGAREGLDDGMLGYYPAISVFRGGAAEVNFGPDFWYPPATGEAADRGDDEVDMVGSEQQQQQQLGLTGQNGMALPNQNKPRAVGERYDEQIVEDIVYDIIDEVDFWMQDGGTTGKGPRTFVMVEGGGGAEGSVAGGGTGVDGGHASEEIKELVQDDE